MIFNWQWGKIKLCFQVIFPYSFRCDNTLNCVVKTKIGCIKQLSSSLIKTLWFLHMFFTNVGVTSFPYFSDNERILATTTYALVLYPRFPCKPSIACSYISFINSSTISALKIKFFFERMSSRSQKHGIHIYKQNQWKTMLYPPYYERVDLHRRKFSYGTSNKGKYGFQPLIYIQVRYP